MLIQRVPTKIPTELPSEKIGPPALRAAASGALVVHRVRSNFEGSYVAISRESNF
jgi:hypothetical protein